METTTTHTYFTPTMESHHIIGNVLLRGKFYRFFLPLFFFFIITVDSPAVAQTGTLTFTNGTQSNIGLTLTDGSYSNDISGIQLNIFNAMTPEFATSETSMGSFVFCLDTDLGLSMAAFVPIDQTSGTVSTGNDATLPRIVVIKSGSGVAFNFQSIYVGDYLGSTTPIKFEGFKNSVSTGSVELTLPSYEDTFTSVDFPTSIFGDVNEVRITNQLDGDMAHGIYAGFNNITIGPPVYTAPSTQATSVTLISTAPGTGLDISWTNGNGSRRVVFMKAGAGSITNPSNGSSYTASANWSAKGTQLGASGYYCIYNGTGNSVSVTNIAPLTQYVVQAFENNGVGSTSAYATSTASGNPSNQTTLPVEITSFTASANGATVTLAWQTATESNNYGFEVERKSYGAWQRIGFVEGSGTTNAPHAYTFVDAASPGPVSYRLKQIDRDGTYAYSEIVEAQAPQVFALSQNFPNPFNPSTDIYFTVPNDGHAIVTIFNTLGQEVATVFDGDAKAHIHNHARFNAAGLASGIYYSRLEYNGKVQLKKMQLLK